MAKGRNEDVPSRFGMAPFDGRGNRVLRFSRAEEPLFISRINVPGFGILEGINDEVTMVLNQS